MCLKEQESSLFCPQLPLPLQHMSHVIVIWVRQLAFLDFYKLCSTEQSIVSMQIFAQVGKAAFSLRFNNHAHSKYLAQQVPIGDALLSHSKVSIPTPTG